MLPMRRLLALVGLTLVILGCDPNKDAGQVTPPAATTAAASATSAASGVAPAAPEQLDVGELKRALKCGAGGHGPCGVLEQLTDCLPWSPVTKSGDGRWLGEGHVVKNGVFVDDFVLLRSKRVNPGDVGPGQLLAKIGIDTIPEDRAAERRHADKAVRAFKRGDVTTATNQAVRYVKQRTEWPEAFSMQTAGPQVFVAVAGGAYLCARKDQRLVVVKRSGSRSHPGDGIYAVLWPVAW